MSKASDWAIKKLKGHFNKPKNKSKVSEITKAAIHLALNGLKAQYEIDNG